MGYSWCFKMYFLLGMQTAEIFPVCSRHNILSKVDSLMTNFTCTFCRYFVYSQQKEVKCIAKISPFTGDNYRKFCRNKIEPGQSSTKIFQIEP